MSTIPALNNPAWKSDVAEVLARLGYKVTDLMLWTRNKPTTRVVSMAKRNRKAVAQSLEERDTIIYGLPTQVTETSIEYLKTLNDKTRMLYAIILYLFQAPKKFDHHAIIAIFNSISS